MSYTNDHLLSGSFTSVTNVNNHDTYDNKDPPSCAIDFDLCDDTCENR